MKNIKYSLEEAKQIANLNNMVLVEREYKNSREKSTFVDGYGYYYFINLSVLLYGKMPNKFHPSNPYTIQNIILWCKLNNKPFKLLSNKYISATNNLEWECFICKDTFQANWNKIKLNRGCAVCHGKQVGLSNCLATKNPDLASQWHPILNGDLTPFDVTIGSDKEVWWQCKNNLKHFWQASVNNRGNGNNCPYCSGLYPTEENNLLIINPELCKEWNYEKNNKYPKDYCPNSGQYAYWICKECGYEWETQIAGRNNGKGCPECNKSKGEKECVRIFDSNNIYYIPQKEFEGLVGLGGGNLSYDFYLPSYNLLVEYDGEFHYKPIKLYKNEPLKYVEERLKKQREHDRLKSEYCQKYNIKLLRIPYWEFDNIEEILQRELNLLEVVAI